MSNGNFNGSCHYPRYSHRLPECLASISTAHGERKINDMTATWTPLSLLIVQRGVALRLTEWRRAGKMKPDTCP